MLRALTFAALLGVPAAAVAQQPCTTDARFVVDQVYRTVLERQPQRQAEADYARRLSNGNMTVKEMVRELATSPEYRQRFAATGNAEANQKTVAALYRHILGRDADSGGLQGYMDVLSKQGPDVVIDALLDSAEYRQNFGDYRVPGAARVEYCGSLGTSGRITPDVRTLDTNGDGRIDRREWRGDYADFDTLDRNRDGVLSQYELRQAGTNGAVGTSGFGGSVPATSAEFDRLDRNRDGRITRNEWNGSAAEFDRIDANGNNVLTPNEFAATERTQSGQNNDVMFRSLDRNGDGRITINEWNWNRRTFDQQDTNSDGAITPWEFTGAPGSRRQ